MKNLFFKNLTITVLILALSGIFYAGYSQKKSAVNPAKAGVKLEYKYPEGKTFKYISDTKVVQDLDVNGQTMLVNIAMYMGCEVKAARKTGDNLNLEITIDSMAQNIESPQGTAGGPIVDVKGKSFNMVTIWFRHFSTIFLPCLKGPLIREIPGFLMILLTVKHQIIQCGCQLNPGSNLKG